MLKKSDPPQAISVPAISAIDSGLSIFSTTSRTSVGSRGNARLSTSTILSREDIRAISAGVGIGIE
jgi:hypothetical protein